MPKSVKVCKICASWKRTRSVCATHSAPSFKVASRRDKKALMTPMSTMDNARMTQTRL